MDPISSLLVAIFFGPIFVIFILMSLYRLFTGKNL